MLAPILNRWDDSFLCHLKRSLPFPVLRWFSAHTCPRPYFFFSEFLWPTWSSALWLANVTRPTDSLVLNSSWCKDTTRREDYSSGHCLSHHLSSKLKMPLTKTQGSTVWQSKISGSKVAQFGLSSILVSLVIKAVITNQLKYSIKLKEIKPFPENPWTENKRLRESLNYNSCQNSFPLLFTYCTRDMGSVCLSPGSSSFQTAETLVSYFSLQKITHLITAL